MEIKHKSDPDGDGCVYGAGKSCVAPSALTFEVFLPATSFPSIPILHEMSPNNVTISTKTLQEIKK